VFNAGLVDGFAAIKLYIICLTPSVTWFYISVLSSVTRV